MARKPAAKAPPKKDPFPLNAPRLTKELIEAVSKAWENPPPADEVLAQLYANRARFA